ncbi:MAG: phytoene desaturase [Pseudomonadota bacterium]
MTTHVTPSALDNAVPFTRPHAVVIGAGFGGLAAAIRLGARGYQVTIVEKLEQAGGRASVFRQDGYTFDAGPTIITAPFVFEELWALCGRRMEDDVTLERLEPFYSMRFDDGETFYRCSDPDKMKAEVARISPGDVAGYEALMKRCEQLYAYGFEQLGDISFHSFKTMMKTFPQMARYRADRSVYGMVSKYIKDERLRIAMSFYPLFVGGNPLRVTSVYCLILHLERKFGVHFARGGTGALVEGLVGLVKGQGGQLRLNAPVDEILTSGNKAIGVKLESGEAIKADLVVSNADAIWGYDKLLPKHKGKRWTDKKISKVAHSMSLFVWYFGTDKRYEDVDHHSIILGPRYKELLTDIFDRKLLADDFSMYLYRPTASDPSMAPDGCDSFYVLSPVPHLEADVDWSKESERYRKKLEARLEETVLPGLSSHIATSKVMTPDDFESRLNAPFGAAFGPEPRMFQSAWYRPHNRSEEVENLYLVGAGTHPGAGVPSVVISAKVLDELVPQADQWKDQNV